MTLETQSAIVNAAAEARSPSGATDTLDIMRIALSVVSILVACGGPNEPSPPPPEVTPEAQSEPEESPAVDTPYAIHEWGFIAHHYADAEGALLTSGSVPAADQTRRVGLPVRHTSGLSGGKPVIYVHLQGEGDVARFTASLSTAGRFLEEWPHSEGSTSTRLTWDVEAKRGSCSARYRYPRAGDRHCTGIADGYCEAAELAHYETQDSACLTVDDAQWNHLFYRAQIAGDVPMRVTKSGENFAVASSGALPGRLMRIQRADEASDTRVALFDAPSPGESLSLPREPDQPAAIGIAALESELGALGMSPSEIDAFMIAWQAELFGDTAERAQVPLVGLPPYDLRPKADALIYFLPTATLDAMVPLAFTPPPADVRRAVLVRVDLGEAHEPGTTGLGNLGHIGHPEPARTSPY